VSETQQSTLSRHARRRNAALARGAQTDASVSTARPDRIVRERECHHRTGLSRSTRWRPERVGQFPRRLRLSPGCNGWRDSEITAWIAARVAPAAAG
jgi:prophage regulatory protein